MGSRRADGPPLVTPDPAALDPEALELLSPEVCRRYGVLPLLLTEGEVRGEKVLTLAAADPSQKDAIDDVAARVGHPIRVVAALREDIEGALTSLFGPGSEADRSIGVGSLGEESAERVLSDPTGRELLRELLHAVAVHGEGGIHLRLRGGETRVEDLEGNELFLGGEAWHAILLDRLRHLAGLSAEERGILQRGRFSFSTARGREATLFRLSLLRGVEGDEVQVRLLTRESGPRPLEELGFSKDQVLSVKKCLERPGLVWVTAPGEEGLASTLFGLLREAPGGKTVTIEDEVFYRSPDFLQLETLELGGGGRAGILRELRYLDFDKVMVDRVGPAHLGDLLDLALRKRWVFAATPQASLRESLGALASRAGELPLFGVRLVIHQRLFPLLCPKCREEASLGSVERKILEEALPAAGPLYEEGEGCEECGGRGVRGSRAFFEVLPVDAALREALHGAARGESRLESLVSAVSPSIREQVLEAVGEGGMSPNELRDFL